MIASILYYNNLEGLNALLWSLYFQTQRPEKIQIFYTGLFPNSAQLMGTLGLIQKKIQVIFTQSMNWKTEGELHLGMIRHSTFLELACNDDDWVMVLDDDLILEPTCIESLVGFQTRRGQEMCAVIPELMEEGRSVDKLERKYHQQFYSNKPIVQTRGSAHGLVATKKQLRSVDLNQHFFLEDTELVSTIKPVKVPEALIYHTKRTTPRPQVIYAMLENMKLVDSQ